MYSQTLEQMSVQTRPNHSLDNTSTRTRQPLSLSLSLSSHLCAVFNPYDTLSQPSKAFDLLAFVAQHSFFRQTDFLSIWKYHKTNCCSRPALSESSSLSLFCSDSAAKSNSFHRSKAVHFELQINFPLIEKISRALPSITLNRHLELPPSLPQSPLDTSLFERSACPQVTSGHPTPSPSSPPPSSSSFFSVFFAYLPISTFDRLLLAPDRPIRSTFTIRFLINRQPASVILPSTSLHTAISNAIYNVHSSIVDRILILL
jgi:hypothetical protein